VMQVMWWMPSSSTAGDRLLPVTLDGVGVANVRFVGIGAGVTQRAALAEQVPAAVELDLDVAETFLVGLEAIGVEAVLLLARAKLMLLGNEALDPVRDALVAHGVNATPAGGG